MQRTRRLTGPALLLLGYLMATALLAWGTTGAAAAVRAPGPADVDVAVTVVAALGALAVLTWLVGVTIALLLATALAGIGSRAHHRALALAPAASRRLVGALLGITVVTAPLSVGTPTGAADRSTSVSAEAMVGSSGGAPLPDLQGPRASGEPGVRLPSLDRPVATAPVGWTPDRPAATARRSRESEAAVRLVSTAPRPGRDAAHEVVVRRGDTLWGIASRHLGPGASVVEVAHEWPRWYVTNRAVIGADPDLLLPGQRLVPPSR